MPEYDFLNLSPPEFEDLTKDILQKHLDITLESFANGRDNGIDLRYSLSPKDNLIIQCKRYKDYNSLLNNLKKEVSKVQNLSPTRYIISTTVGLTPNQKDVIFALFSPYILNISDIFGRNDLNGLLTSEIEKRHFKLWLSSTNILDKILHSKIHNLSNFEEEIIKETINVYVDNESYYNANKIIKDKKYVIISGIPGIGKTTLARILVYHYLANGFEEFVFLSDSINDAYTIYKEGVKQIFLFDDFLGTNFLENKLSTNEELRIVKFIEKVSKSKDKIIILTTREYILANLMTSGTPILLDELKLITKNFAKSHSVKYGISYSEIEFKKSIRELENIFIKIGKDTINQLVVEYQNPSVQDFLVFYFVEFVDYLKDIINSAKYFNQLFRIFSLGKSSPSFSISNKILLGGELKKMVLGKLINEFDFLNSTTLVGSNYSIWKKEYFSDIIKLNEIDKSLTVDDYPELREFMKAKFEILLEPIELEGKELNCYTNLLYEFYSDFEIDGLKVIQQFAENITELDEIEELEKLETFFPTEYEIFIKDDKDFSEIISTIIADEAENVDDDFEEKLTELTTVADKFKIDIKEVKKQIENKIEEKKIDDENSYDWDSENTNDTAIKKNDDNETIKNIFDSLRTEDKNGG